MRVLAQGGATGPSEWQPATPLPYPAGFVRTTAGGAASARGGAMSKLPELRASARAAAAAPLATDRLAPAMLMTGALVSDATRGAPGRRGRRVRCAQRAFGVWLAERRGIAGKRHVSPRTVELEAEGRDRTEECHGVEIWYV